MGRAAFGRPDESFIGLTCWTVGGEIMHGGMKFYRGSPGAARTYVEQDRSRADDYYLAEGSGVATPVRRLTRRPA